MCGRYYVDDDTAREIEKVVREVEEKLRKERRGDIYPSQSATVITGRKPHLFAEEMSWGFPQYQKKGLLINARAEGQTTDLREFDTFWEILDSLLNSILYVMMGLKFIHILQMPEVLLISCLAVIFNLIGRFPSVGLATLFVGKLPNGYG